MSIQLKFSGLKPFLQSKELETLIPQVELSHAMLLQKSGAGNDFLGWVDLPETIDPQELLKIKNAALKIQKNSQVLVIIGIGGSYLGARAAMDFILSPFYNNQPNKKTPDIYFVGNNISSTYLQDVLAVIGDRDFSINVISKSGTTTEPAIAFRILKGKLEQKYGKEGAKERIFATTDKEKGALKLLCDKEGYETFVIPDDVGGRFSVLTPVGLLPMAAAGIEIDEVLQGAKDARNTYQEKNVLQNDCLLYAAIRSCLLRKGKAVEILANYEPGLTMFGEWFKQLFAESEGKDGKGIFPVSANFSTDLHSIGQFIQDGNRIFFETVLWFAKARQEMSIPEDADNVDGLNFLSEKSMQFVNSKAFGGTLLAHVDGGVPNIILEAEQMDAYHFGYLVYFFEKAVAVSGYLLGVNPFDQPGVESYKKNMFALLGKPGYEKEKEQLEERLTFEG